MIGWRARSGWRYASTSAGSSVSGTWHAFDLDKPLPPLPHSQARASVAPLCGRSPESLERMRDAPPENTAAICRKCWIASGRAIADLDAQREAVMAAAAIRRHELQVFEEWRSKVMYVLPEDLVAFLERYEIYETPEFVRAALDAIARDRKAEAVQDGVPAAPTSRARARE